jgi:hypothetical protein
MNALKFSEVLLNRYINYGWITAPDKILSCLFPKLPFILNASKIRRFYHETNLIADGGLSAEIDIPVYNGQNKVVTEIQKLLEKELSSDLAFALVHGSLGTTEEIPYSDFDGLVILRNQVFSSNERLAKVAISLSRAHGLMLKLDPLQHHGWFVLCERDLKCWPAAYFPEEILRHSKSLLNGSAHMSIRFNKNDDEFATAFKRVSESVKKQLREPIPENSYKLKGLLSEFMLLPALFIQAKNKKGIFKKYSFEEAKKYFPAGDWAIMDHVSIIRKEWKNRSELTITEPVIMSYRVKQTQLKSALPEKVALKELSMDYIQRMIKLVTLMQEKLQ